MANDVEADTKKIELVVRNLLADSGWSKELCIERHLALETRITAMQEQTTKTLDRLEETNTKLFAKLDTMNNRGHANLIVVVQILSTIAIGVALFVLQGVG